MLRYWRGACRPCRDRYNKGKQRRCHCHHFFLGSGLRCTYAPAVLCTAAAAPADMAAHALLPAQLPRAVPHCAAGWAIEGAIGSEYKIDASYLSPHVNMASRLEVGGRLGLNTQLAPQSTPKAYCFFLLSFLEG